jgi:large subunit ribosomal protein L10
VGTLKLQDKKAVVEELQEKFRQSRIVIVTDYKGLNVEKMNALRRKLREENIEYRVVKNTLLVRAAQDTDAAPLAPHFTGPSAVAMSFEDPVAPARVLTDFAKENEKLEIKIGLLRGKILEVADIKALSLLPSRDVLLGQLLSAMNGVPGGFVRTLAAVPQGLLNALAAIKDQKDQPEAA